MLNSELYNYQNDPRWKDIQIVETRDFTLGSSGCLITSLTNAFNDYNKQNAECKSCYLPYTPDMLLGLLKQHKAINEDALVVWSAAEEALNMECEPFCSAPDPYFSYQIVQFTNFGYSHFSNVLGILDDGDIRIYDTYNGSVKDLLPNQVRRWINVRFHK